ncbi:4'-phosphopantetheinyl transferase family protein [Thaumasiovibrio subtropicus]|uniref:4'-phosphopantetheinyl transferase family protein n=2 Tax=Thaumasiovibrio subtropicus TaxID=1891207 RepID=UPI001C8466C2|nr:4'-phosphopantetheinyl transferase superfamily protein [Thaumasiovibrio subtropicus]
MYWKLAPYPLPDMSPFVSRSFHVVTPDENLHIYGIHYDASHYHHGLFDRYGITAPNFLNQAVAKRNSEYLAGRLVARQAMASGSHCEMHQMPQITTGQHREPRWPQHLLGAITHSDNIALAVVAAKARFRFIGIDYEEILCEKTATSIASQIVDEEEKAILTASSIPFEHALTLAFSAKESVYKAIFGEVQQVLSFQDAKIVHLEEGRLTLQLGNAVIKRLRDKTCLFVYFTFKFNGVITLVASD